MPLFEEQTQWLGRLFAVSCPAGHEHVLRNIPDTITHPESLASQGTCAVETELLHSMSVASTFTSKSSDPEPPCFCAAVVSRRLPPLHSIWRTWVPVLEFLAVSLPSYPKSVYV